MNSPMYDILVQDRLIVRKKRDITANNLLTVLIGAIDKRAKDDNNRRPKDEDVIAELQKLLKGVNENLSYLPGDKAFVAEKAMLEYYMPPSLSEDQIISLLVEHEFINIGSAMSFFKMNHPGQYESKRLLVLVQEYLASQKK